MEANAKTVRGKNQVMALISQNSPRQIRLIRQAAILKKIHEVRLIDFEAEHVELAHDLTPSLACRTVRSCPQKGFVFRPACLITIRCPVPLPAEQRPSSPSSNSNEPSASRPN